MAEANDVREDPYDRLVAIQLLHYDLAFGKTLLFNYWPIPLVLGEHTFGLQ